MLVRTCCGNHPKSPEHLADKLKPTRSPALQPRSDVLPELFEIVFQNELLPRLFGFNRSIV